MNRHTNRHSCLDYINTSRTIEPDSFKKMRHREIYIIGLHLGAAFWCVDTTTNKVPSCTGIFPYGSTTPPGILWLFIGSYIMQDIHKLSLAFFVIYNLIVSGMVSLNTRRSLGRWLDLMCFLLSWTNIIWKESSLNQIVYAALLNINLLWFRYHITYMRVFGVGRSVIEWFHTW